MLTSLAWAAVLLVVASIWISTVFFPWYDVIIRRSDKHFPVGFVLKHDGGWYRVVKVAARPGPYDAMFGDRYSDVFLRRLPKAEAVVREVMDS